MLYRQGDVLIRRIDKIPLKKRRSKTNDERRLVLAHGEATGHAHVITAKPSEARIRKGTPDPRSPELTFLEVLSPTGVELVHDEHATILIPPGEYEITRQREYSPAQAAREARVRD